METDSSSQQAQEGASPDEPPLGGPRLVKKSIIQAPFSTASSDDPSKKDVAQSAHTLSAKQVADLLETNIDHGLSNEEVEKRRLLYGDNTVKGAEGLSIWKILLRQISNSLTLVLAITMAISFGIHDYIEGGVIAAVICLNIVVGFTQDYQAEKEIQALYALSAPHADVLRSNVRTEVKASELTVGDIVYVSVGNVVPADIRIATSVNLSADESSLTGESLTVSKKPDLLLPLEAGIGDRKNMAWSGMSITQGRGCGIVIAIGMDTELGKIAALMGSKQAESKENGLLAKALSKASYHLKAVLGLLGTPLTVSLSKFALLLFGLAISLTIIVFGANKFDVQEDVLIYGICVAVAIIPESLIAVLTITVAVGAKAMYASNVLVRTMSSLEAVGGVTNICSDKTGTLTQGRMVATQAWTSDERSAEVTATDNPYDPESGQVSLVGLEKPSLGSQDLFSSLMRTMALCNLATVSRIDSKHERGSSFTPNDCWTANGEPTEVALQVMAMRFGFSRNAVIENEQLHMVAEYPFDSSAKRMSMVYRDSSKAYHIFTKGAIEVLIDRITSSDTEKAKIRHQVDMHASQGLRVLAFGHRKLDAGTGQTFEQADRASIEQNLDFLGLVGIHDPPRPESKDAVQKCKEAGIKVHMLTGDHRVTAEAIAKSIGILQDAGNPSKTSSEVMVASNFDNMTDERLDRLDELPLVVARCSPSTKVRMIEAMHRRSAFCVMTGDGVNDAPALKRADVGIAMGQNGSDVAKEAADMVLTDDNFASIIKAIEEGRRLFDNIQKFLLHLLISNISQVLLLLIGLAFRDSDGKAVFPLAPLEILWVNLITSSFLAIGLGLEKAQRDIMQRPPHDLKVGIFTKELIIDKMVYGTFMGSLCLAAFASVVYGAGNGDLGQDCNDGWNDSCDVVFRARATTYATLTWLLLVTAWEVKHFHRSLFNLDPSRFRSPFAVWPAVRDNRFLFWAVTAGFTIQFGIIYIPVINKQVFRHSSITWEWGIVVSCLLAYVALVEAWKAFKRRGLRGSRKRLQAEKLAIDSGRCSRVEV